MMNDILKYFNEGEYALVIDIIINSYNFPPDEAPTYDACIDIAKYWLHNQKKINKKDAPMKIWDDFIINVFNQYENFPPALFKSITNGIMKIIYKKLTENQFIPSDNNPLSIKLDLARNLLWMRKLHYLIPFLKELIKKYPKQSETWGMLGKVYFLKKEFKKSILCYREAFFINPSVLNLIDVKSDFIDKIVNYYVKNFGNNDRLPPNNQLLQWIGICGIIGEFFSFRRELSEDDLIELDKRILVYEKKYELYKSKEDLLNLVRLCVFKIDYFAAQNKVALNTLKKLETLEPLVYKKIKLIRG